MNRQTKSYYSYPSYPIPNSHREHRQFNSRSKVDRISSSLETFQQALGVIHSTTPFIEKYGPMIQKIPTMYRIYRAIKQVDNPNTKISTTKENTHTNTSEGFNQMNMQIGSYPLPTLYI